MKRTLTSLAISFTVLTMLGAALPAAAQLTWGMPGGSIMGEYENLMNQYGGGFTPGITMPDYGWGGGSSLMNGMPTVGIDQWYNHYHNNLMDLWRATGYGSLGILRDMNGAYQNNAAARAFTMDRWAHEGIRGDEPVYLDIPGRTVIYPDDLGW